MTSPSPDFNNNALPLRVDIANNALLAAVEEGDITAAEQALAQGASVHFDDNGKANLLFWAVTHDHPATAKWLVGQGLDPNAIGGKGLTPPLHHAVAAGKRGMVEALLEAGADIHASDKDGKPPVFNALWSVEMLELMIEKGADPDLDIHTRYGRTPLMQSLTFAALYDQPGMEAFEFLLGTGPDLNLRDKKGDTALFYAVKHHSWETIERLIALGADQDVKNNNEMTVQDLAARQGQTEIAAKLLAKIEKRNLEEEFKDYSTAIKEDMDAPKRIQPRRLKPCR